MAKKAIKKRSSIGKDFIQKPAPDAKDADKEDQEAKVGFGGLPDRDLKKNLGCG